MTTVRVDQPRTIREHLTFLYGNSTGKAIQRRLQRILEHYATQLKEARDLPLTQRDALLITYGDQVRHRGQPPLQTLATCTVDESLRGGVLGVFQSAVSMAIILSTAIAGVIFSIGPTLPYWTGAVLSLAAILPALSVLRRSNQETLTPCSSPSPSSSPAD